MHCLVFRITRKLQHSHIGARSTLQDKAEVTFRISSHRRSYHVGCCRKLVPLLACSLRRVTSSCACACAPPLVSCQCQFRLQCHPFPLAVHRVQLSGAVPSSSEDVGETISTSLEVLQGVRDVGDDKDYWYLCQHGSIEALKALLSQCAAAKDLAMGRHLHSLMLTSDNEIWGSLGSCFIHMFACCGSLLEANVVFSQIPIVCIIAWQAIIEAHTLLDQAKTAISLYFRMQGEGLFPSKRILICILGSCTKGHELIYGRMVHDQATRAGQSSDIAVGTCLVHMYAKCSSIAEAQKVFDSLPFRNVVTWNTLIVGYAMAGETATVLLLLEKMKRDKISPEMVTFLSVLKSFIGLRSLGPGTLICNEIFKSGFDVDAVVGNTLVDLYAKCGLLQEAYKVFQRLEIRDVVSWNALISGHVKGGRGDFALELFRRMPKEGVNPDIFSFSCAFQACGSIEAGEEGNELHNYLIVGGLDMDMYIGSTLLHMYAKCGKLEEARQVFNGFPKPNSVMWGVMIAGYTQHGHYVCGLELFKKMHGKSVEPDAATFPYVLNSCASLGALSSGMVVHNQIISSQFQAELSICNALIDMYSKCGCLREAQQVFDQLPVRDVVSWNSLIAGYAQHKDSISALALFKKMQEKTIEADKVTFLGALQSCSSIGAVVEGMQLHHMVCYQGLELDMLLGSSLVDLYAKQGCLGEAHAVFSGLPSPDVVACSAMISGYVQQGLWSHATHLYYRMVQKSIKPDNGCFAFLLKACCHEGAISDCKCVHDKIVEADLDTDVLVGNALIDMYAKCGRLCEARYVFNALSERSLVSWNTIMTGYAENDDGFQVLELFEFMLEEGLCANKVSYLSTLKACSSLGSLGHVFYIHDQIIRSSLELDLVVGNMIIDTYARCGSLQEAHRVFDSLSHQDVISWSALIAGYAQHRGLQMASHYIHAMQQSGVNPVSQTFTSILGACGNGGQVADGQYYFRSMREEYGIIPSIEHCNCMIDILGRAGCLDDARKFLCSMPTLPNMATWMSLLTSCRTFSSIEFGRLCFEQANKLNPYNSSAYMIMSKIYVDANMWAEVHKLEEARKQKFVWKKPGKACIEFGGKVYQFTAGKRNLQCYESLFSMPLLWMRMLKERGYIPGSDSVLETEVSCADKEAFV